MDCEQALALISARLDREILPSENEWLSHHLRGCAACQATAEAFALQHAELKETFEPRRAAVGATVDRVNAAVVSDRRKAAPKRRLHIHRGVLIGAGIAAAWLLMALMLLLYLGRNSPTGPAMSSYPMPPTPQPVTPTPSAERLTPRNLPKSPPPTPLKEGATVTTAAGERRRETLPNGSRVYLNENTSLIVQQSNGVTLERGTAYFELISRQTRADQPPASPFMVATTDRAVTADGSKFAVQQESGGTRLLAVEGDILASNSTPQSPDSAPVFILHAGEMLEPHASVASPSPRLSHVLDWTRDLIAASETSLVPASSFDGGALIAVDSNGQEAKLSLRKYHVDVHIEDGFARTTIDQTYFNQHPWRLEGTFYFPLPPDASLSRLAMYVDGQLNEGGMVDRDYGRTVYDRVVNGQRDPALLEWVDGSTFKMRVFPLEGRQEKRIILSYTQRVPTLYGRSQYRFPAGHSLQRVDQWSFHALVKNGANYVTASPTHPGLKRGTQSGDLVLDDAARECKVDRDILLDLTDPSFTAEDKDAARFARAAMDGNEYLMLRYRPQLPAHKKRERRDWIFLYETSADRDPLLARAQIEIIRGMLQNAERDDKFIIIASSNRAIALQNLSDVPGTSVPKGPLPQSATPEAIATAMTTLEQTHLIGALDLGSAFRAAASEAGDATNCYFVHVGGGYTGMGTPQDELAKFLPSKAKYIGIGVGKHWNRAFMKQCAEKTGGYFTQINPDESIGWRTFDLMATLNTPRLLDVKVADARQKQDDDKGPRFLLDSTAIAQGEELCAVARLRAMPDALRITGKLDGEPFERTVRVDNVAKEAAYIPRTWAKLEIDRLLMEDARKNKDTIVELSKAMYVMTPFTSLLVLENEAMYKEFKVDRGRKDHWAMYTCPDKIPVVYEPDATMPTDVRNAPKGMKPTANQVLQTVCVRVPPHWLESVQSENWDKRKRLDGTSLDTFAFSGTLRGMGAGGGMPVSNLGYSFNKIESMPRSRTITTTGPANSFLEDDAYHLTPERTHGGMGRERRPSPVLLPAIPSLTDALPAESSKAVMSASEFGLPTRGSDVWTPDLTHLNAILDNWDTLPEKERVNVKRLFTGKERRTYAVQELAVPGQSSTLPIAIGISDQGTIYSRLSFNHDQRLFTDLLSYAPGLNTSEADILAIVEAEAMPDLRQAPGSIDAKARELIDGCRKGGWQKLTLPGDKGQPDQVILFDAAGRYTYERTLPLGLREVVVCDGETLLHQYPEIGLAGRRTVSRFHRAELNNLLPWLLPPAEDLARGVDVKWIDENTIELMPHHLRNARNNKDEAASYVCWHLLFEKGRFVERRLVEMPTKKTLVREIYDGAGGIRLLDDNDKELSNVTRQLTDAKAPNLRPDVSALVVLPLPYRSRAHVLDELKFDSSAPLSAGENGCYEYLNDADCLNLLTALVAEQNAGETQLLYRRCFHERGDRRRGLFTLLAAAGVDVSREPGFREQFAKTPDDELLQYVGLCGQNLYHYVQQRFPLHSGRMAEQGRSFLHDLSDAQALLYRWNSPNGRSLSWEDHGGDVKRSLAFLSRHQHDVLGLALLYEMQDRTYGKNKIGQETRNLVLAHQWQHLAESNDNDYRARYEQACALDRGGKRREAADVFRKLYAHALEARVLPPLDRRFVSALQILDEKPLVDEWNPLMRDTARAFIKDKNYAAVVVLASQCRRLDEPALGDTLLADLLRTYKETGDEVATKLMAVQYYMNANELARAEALFQELLPLDNLPGVLGMPGVPGGPGLEGMPPVLSGPKSPTGSAQTPAPALTQPLDPKLARSPEMWRLGARLADRRGKEAQAIACLEKALDLEYQDLPEVIDLRSWRTDYGKLLDYYAKVAQSAKSLRVPAPADLATRTVQAIDRWRAHDPEAGDACNKAAEVFALLGKTDLAWDFSTTMMIGHGLEVGRWQSVAADANQHGDYSLADRALIVASEVDPTNAEVVWERAKNLRQAQKNDEADKLMRRLAHEHWPERYQGICAHAQNYLGER